jgi:beta-lactamase regulating signal transducer with metallopeptidase domain
MFITVLNMSLTASYVIAVIILVRLFLKKSPKIISYLLWAVAGFRLMFPLSFESIFSLIPFESQPIPQAAALGENVSFGSTAGAALRSVGDAANGGLGTVTVYLGKTADGYAVTTRAYHSEVWIMFGSYLWLIGVAILLIYCVISFILLKRRMRAAILAEDNIYEAVNLKTPFVFGIIDPKIYIPSGLSEETKSYIILHERIHIRRYDHLVKLVAFLILCVHWFNPLVWGAFLLMCADMEMSCDERVLREMGGDIKKAYSISLLSMASGRSLINGSPISFGEGNIKSRIKNVLSFKKPATWVIALSIVLVTVLSVGFATSRVTPNNLTNWVKYDLPSYLYDRATLTTEAEVYPPSFDSIDATLTNQEMEGGLRHGENYTLVKQHGNEWLIVPFAKDRIFTSEAMNLLIRESYTYTITPDILAAKLDEGHYRIITEVWYATEQQPIKHTVWADFMIAAPDSTGWQDVRIGMPRDEVHKIMSEPVGMLSGLFGDIYRLDNGSGIIFYYDSTSSVNHIKLMELSNKAQAPSTTGASNDNPDAERQAPWLIADADLDRDGRSEYIYLDGSQIESNFDITLKVLDIDGNEMWSESVIIRSVL